ncbi:MAG: hypothetical protein Fur0010_18540 [Bdellovibrio sp.]
MTTSLMVLQLVTSVLLIIVVLLQFGKGAEAGLMGSTDTVFSSAQQGNILSKITVFLSVLFLVNSVLLARIQTRKGASSILDSEAPISMPLNSDAAPLAAPAETKKEQAPAETKTEQAPATETKK